MPADLLSPAAFNDTLTSSVTLTNDTTITLTSPERLEGCVVGAVAPQSPANLSIFQLFPAPSQPPDLPCWEVAVKVVFYVLAFLVTVTGNTLVILAISLNKRLRSTTNVLLLNLAVSDLLVAAVCMWVHLGNSITPEWPFSQTVCKVNTFCQVVVLTSSVLTLTMISVERFIAIVFPLKGHWSGFTTGVIIGVTWLTAVAVASPHLFVRRMYEQQWKDRREVWCDEVWPQVYRDEHCKTWEPGKLVYYSIEGIVMYAVPVVIMLAAYSVITYRLVTRRIPGILLSSTISAQERATRKVIKMLVAVFVCFVVCWSPQQFILLYRVFRPYFGVPVDQVQEYHQAKYAALYIAYLNSAVNPVLYCGFNDNFRRALTHLCRSVLAKRHNRVHPGEVKPVYGEGGGRGPTFSISSPSSPSSSPVSSVRSEDGDKRDPHPQQEPDDILEDVALPPTQTSCRRCSMQADDACPRVAWKAV